MPALPKVSVIIPTWNSASTFDLCLQSLNKLSYPEDRIEVIIVDHGSTDSTLRIADTHSARILSFPEAKTISELRNFGVYQSDGDILAFLDSDCLVHSDWLANAVAELSENTFDVTGSEYLTREDPSWIERCWCEHRTNGNREEGSTLPAGNMVMYRDVFYSVGGFDEDFVTAEDTDICLRLKEKGCRIVSSGKIRAVHLGESRTLAEFFRKEVWHGSGMLMMLSRHRVLSAVKIPLLSILYLLGFAAALISVILQQYIPAFTVLTMLIIVIPLVLGSIRAAHGKHSNLLAMSFLYLVYFLARAVSIIRYNQIFSMLLSRTGGSKSEKAG